MKRRVEIKVTHEREIGGEIELNLPKSVAGDDALYDWLDENRKDWEAELSRQGDVSDSEYWFIEHWEFADEGGSEDV